MSETFHLFERFGVELEYMLVDAQSLNVRPLADQILGDAAGPGSSDYENGPISWSNELVNHVIEFKTTDPVPSLAGLAEEFQANVAEVNQRASAYGAMLLPTAMHPWMDPHTETKLWPHENSEVYRSFDRIFDCRGHGWANLQSVHLNLPFADDAEFARLHAAIRMVLPILPALAASSPLVDGKPNGILDNRLEFYRFNSKRIPSVTARVIPEPVFSLADYEREIFQRMYGDIAPHDPGGILQHEWLNARGAIARFDRNTIEIRLLDIQECPQADLAIVTLVAALLSDLAAERFVPLAELQAWPVEPLADLFEACLRDADQTLIANRDYAGMLDCVAGDSLTVGELWRHLVDRLCESHAEVRAVRPSLDVILEHGTLARRILAAAGAEPSRDVVTRVFAQLADCLSRGESFAP